MNKLKATIKINSYKVCKYGFLSFMLIVIAIVFYRLYILKPQFFIKVAKIAIVAVIVVIVCKFFKRNFSKKCPLCGSIMSEQVPIRLFDGAVNKKRVYPAIGKRIIVCDNCKNELHLLFYYEDNTAFVKQDLEGYLKHRVVAKNELATNINLCFNEMTEVQYNKLRQSFINKVNNHNQKAGFKKNIKQIKKIGR